MTVFRISPALDRVERRAHFASDRTFDSLGFAKLWIKGLRDNFRVTSCVIPNYFDGRPGWHLVVSDLDPEGYRHLAVVHPRRRSTTEVVDVVASTLMRSDLTRPASAWTKPPASKPRK
ncbi:hypothetical protein ACGFIU_19495 [Rhodococcus oryzae]|uniref:hypothetical protein n=1 Tax=Rhodococcus oryzae TaxID=2571143 RepID=UPI003722480F